MSFKGVWETLGEDEMDELIAGIPEAERGPWKAFREQRKAGLAYRAELIERGEWHEALQMCGSEDRAAILVDAADRLSDDEAAELLRDWWSTTEAWSGDERLREGMYGLLRRVAPLVVLDGDSAEVEQEFLACEADEDGWLTIYRGNLGEDARLGHSWSLDKAIAQKFARMAMSPRGMFLGMYREDGVPSVWAARVRPADVLGYFDDRGEAEVVVDPETLVDVEKIQEAV